MKEWKNLLDSNSEGPPLRASAALLTDSAEPPPLLTLTPPTNTTKRLLSGTPKGEGSPSKSCSPWEAAAHWAAWLPSQATRRQQACKMLEVPASLASYYVKHFLFFFVFFNQLWPLWLCSVLDSQSFSSPNPPNAGDLEQSLWHWHGSTSSMVLCSLPTP